jgi:hypothetical protein
MSPIDRARQVVVEPLPGRDGLNTVKYSVEHLLPIDGRVGVPSMEWQRYPKHKVKEVAVAAVYVGNGNIGRTFAVFEKIA